jgi:putative glutamine amidotransferase
MTQSRMSWRSNEHERPRIGVTKPSRGGMFSFWAICAAIRLEGGWPVGLSASAPASTEALHGLVLGGGVDVDPQRFGAAQKLRYAYDDARDAMELAWLDRAAEADLPTLGICRGAQLMNVAAGGTLHLDLPSRFGWAAYPQHWLRQSYFRKWINVAPGTRLHAVLGVERLRVNSVHSQAIDAVGAGLVVSAREDNGIAQVIERPDAAFWIGVQFHPEFLIRSVPCRRLFRSFVSAASEHKRASPGRARSGHGADPTRLSSAGGAALDSLR